jgi:hypothetical protein
MKLKVLSNHCGDPYLVRFELFELLGWSLKLHVFLRGDEDEELHDHPWSFWTLVICGGYWEEVPIEEAHRSRGFHLIGPSEPITKAGPGLRSALILRRSGSLSFRPAQWKHAVRLDPGRACATLVLTSPKSRDWGFWSPLTELGAWSFTPWRKFVDDRNHPC